MWSILPEGITSSEVIVATILSLLMFGSVASVYLVLKWMDRRSFPERRDAAFTEALRRVGQGVVIGGVVEAVNGGWFTGLMFAFLGVTAIMLLEFTVLEIREEPQPDSWHV